LIKEIQILNTYNLQYIKKSKIGDDKNIMKIKVLVVDDSLLFQKFLVKAINSDPELEVIGTASNPFEARDAIIKHKPDVMTLDVEMPRMNGIEFLRQLLPQYKLPTVMVSSLNEVVFDALSVGAVDFVNKPTSLTALDIEDFVKNELAAKIKIAVHSKIVISSKPIKRSAATPNKKDISKSPNVKKPIPHASGGPAKHPIDIIAIGASTGGTEAILSVISQLRPNVPGIVITQHMPPGFTDMYAKRLNLKTALTVKEAQTGDTIQRGTAFIAPGDKHLTIYKENGVYKTRCSKGAKVSGHCPSVDVLFNSVAEVAKKNAIGVILTGMGADGATGLMLMCMNGAETIGQDEESCIVYGMPKVAYTSGAVKYQLPLLGIPGKIHQLLGLR